MREGPQLQGQIRRHASGSQIGCWYTKPNTIILTFLFCACYANLWILNIRRNKQCFSVWGSFNFGFKTLCVWSSAMFSGPPECWILPALVPYPDPISLVSDLLIFASHFLLSFDFCLPVSRLSLQRVSMIWFHLLSKVIFCHYSPSPGL